MKKQITNHILSTGIVLVLITFVFACKKDAGTSTSTTATGTTATTPVATTPATYTLIWSDEFNGTVVDATKWTMETGNLHVNNEKEYYQAANATVADGNLIITAKKESVSGQPYTSARMNTLNKFSAHYGRIEARIKLPLGAGLWPAFWMMGANINTVSWPNCGEIDIMEHINADSVLFMAPCTGTEATDMCNMAYPLNLHFGRGLPHVYAVEWDTNSIRWYVDNTLYM